MSELKEIGIRWEENGKLHFSHVYLKSEADKVIAELKDKALQYKVLYKEKCRDINSQEQHFAKQLYRHKYKRCLAVADYWGLVSALVHGETQLKCMRREMKWRKLAEKFKPNKEAE